MFATLLLSSMTARADGVFDFTGATCVPDSTAVEGALYANSNGGVGHAPGKTAMVALHCAFPHRPDGSSSTLNTLTMLYSDSSAVAGNKVTSSLYKMSKTTGALFVVTTVDSDGSTCGTGSPRTCFNYFYEDIDSENYYYFLGVYIYRTSATSTEIFWGATVRQ